MRVATAISRGVARAVETAGLHIAGLAVAASLIPLDLYQMIVSSIKIHHKKLSEIVQGIFTTADDLETELKLFLITEHYFLQWPTTVTATANYSQHKPKCSQQ